MNIDKKRKTVLHITPHLGGGVGSVLLNYLAETSAGPDFTHQVLSLEYANDRAKTASKTTGFFLADKMSEDHQGLLNAISGADIVLIHWWNHPLLYALLVRESLPPARIIFWSHISGFHVPYVFNRPALLYPDLFVFTSPLSLDCPEVKSIQGERRKAFRVIWSTGGVEHMVSIRSKPHSGFTVGYIGTVDYGKLHPNFLKMCRNVAIPDVHFVVCGGPSEKQIRQEAERYGLDERFTFTGPINSINGYLEIFDIFGYPLAPYHYGTCEQSLGESMAAGIPPVVLANRTESLIVDDGVTGIVAQDEGAYTKAIGELYRNQVLRRQLADNARKASRERYSLDLMVNSWEGIFHEALNLPKTPRRWTGKRSGKSVPAAQVFIEALGTYGTAFENNLIARNEKEKEESFYQIRNLYGSSLLWQANTRGTANHYHFFFPEDDDLSLWSGLVWKTL